MYVPLGSINSAANAERVSAATPAIMEERGAGVMQLERRHDLSAFTDPEAGRYAFNRIHYNAKHRELAATDSRMLAIVPVVSDLDRNAMFDAAELATRARIGGGYDVTSDGAGESSLGGAECSTEGKFPDYRRVLSAKEPAISVWLDPRRLRAICKHAVKSFKDEQTVVSLCVWASEDAIELKHYHDGKQVARYILMPMTEPYLADEQEGVPQPCP